MNHQHQARKFLQFANDNYTKYKKIWKTYFFQKQLDFDEDVFSDTIIKVYDYIIKHGIKDDSEEGLANYWFKSFQTNSKRELQYSRNSARDKNVDVFSELRQRENGEETLKKKIRNQVFDDYTINYLLNKLEPETDTLTFYCFRLYYLLPKMTYQKLKELTKVQDCKKRVVNAKKWLQENVSKEELINAFNQFYEE